MKNISKKPSCPIVRVRDYPDCFEDCATEDQEKCPFRTPVKAKAKKLIKEPGLEWAVPDKLKIPADPLQLRVDFHRAAVVVYTYNKDTTTRKIVSAMDLVHALASELTFSSGLLPENTIWWANTSAGPVYALYEEPKVRKLAIQYEANKSPKRYTFPVPPCLFICQPGHAPRIFAVKRRPTKISDAVYHAPFPNITSRNGATCGGNNKYPTEVGKIPESFWLSFFTDHGDLGNRSVKFPKNLLRLWDELDEQYRLGKGPWDMWHPKPHKERRSSDDAYFPLEDLMPYGTVGDVIKISDWR
jgi:hypothetical protein